MAAVFAAGALRAEYNVIDTPTIITMDGPTLFTATGPNVTNVWTGKITGTGPAIIEGGGTVAFANSANDYTGGTLVSNAVFRLDADGCAGSGAITGATSSAHVFVDCATVPNDLVFIGSGFCTSYMAPNAYPAAQQNPLLPLRSAVTLEGLVTFSQLTMLYDSTDPSMVSPAPTVTYKKGITVKKDYTYLCPKGRMIFEGKYKCSSYQNNTYLGYKSNAYGTMEFRASSNTLYRAALYSANLDFKAVDVFPSTVFYYQYGAADRCKTLLNGNDQTILGICWGTDGSRPKPGETSTGMCITSDVPAAVRIVGCEMGKMTGSLVNRLALFGKVTLVMDVNSTYTEAGFYQDFSVRKSTTTGDLIISNGDFRVTGGASFPNVPNIYVGTGGTFSSSTTTNAFAGCRNLVLDGTMTFAADVKTPFTDGAMALSLGASAHLTLPAGYTLTVQSLKVGGESKPYGTYGDGGIALTQISQGTVIVRSHDRYVDCNTTDTVNDGSEAHPYKTIKAATDNALSGDVIHVAPGTYGASEGLPQKATEASKIGTRVVIPENVTIESTDGPEVTFIVGAAAYDNQIDNATYGTGTNAVRCVYAKNGATLRGFTLTGGRGIGVLAGDGGSWTIDHASAAFRAASSLGATIENCIVSNNIAYVGTIYNAVVKNCIVVGNRGLRGGSNTVSPAGYQCSWHGSVIDGNYGHGTIYAAAAIENCTIGSGNKDTAGTGSPQVLYWYGGGDHAVINTAILGGRFYMGGTAVICCTNCLLIDDTYLNSTMRARAYNCIITNSAAMQVDAKYRPILGSFAGIDAGDAAYSSDELGDKDILGTPRVLNGALDIGAVEYDWRPTFAAELGKRFKLTFASPSVTTNAAGGLLVPDGAVAGTVPSAGPYAIAFTLAGGSLAVYVGGELAGESSGTGEQSIRFTVANDSDEIRFVYTPEAESTAVLEKFSGARGFSISFR